MQSSTVLVGRSICSLHSSPRAHASLAPVLLSISPQRSRDKQMLPSLRDVLKKFKNHEVYPSSPFSLPFSAVKVEKEDYVRRASEDMDTYLPRKLSIHDLLCDSDEVEKKIGRKAVNPRRQCRVNECHKYALAGGYCIRHGGGRRCKFQDCKTVAQSGGLCKAHGGGSRCRILSCDNVARRQGFCMLHGGRIECKFPGCYKCAHRGGYCIAHGGGKRCSVVNCLRSVQTKGLCYSHGGGKRCKVPYCQQAARKGGSCMRHRTQFMLR